MPKLEIKSWLFWTVAICSILGLLGFLFSFSEGEININDTTIINNLNVSSTTYLPTSFFIEVGTEAGGNNLGNMSYSDGETFDVNEEGGFNALLLYINFTNISGIPTFITMGHRYFGNHIMYLEIWDYDSLDWEIYDTIIMQPGIIKDAIALIDGQNHINDNGTLQTRFTHPQNGNINDIFLLDFLNIVVGFSTISTNEHDGLAGRNNESNHPWALPKSGGEITNNLTVHKNMTFGGCTYYNTSATDIFKICADGSGECSNSTDKYITVDYVSAISTGDWCT